MLYEITNRAYSGAHAQCVVHKDVWTHVICVILICGWCDVLFFTKFYLKSIRRVIPIYIVRDDRLELISFLDKIKK